MSEKQRVSFVVSEFKQKFTSMNLNSAEIIENQKFCKTELIHWLKYSLLKVHSYEEILHILIFEKIPFNKFCSLL